MIVQAKTSPGFSESVLDKFIGTTPDLIDLERPLDSLKSVYNARLLAAAALFRNVYQSQAGKLPALSVRFFYATTGERPHANTVRKVERLTNTLKAFISNAVVDCQFVGAKGLLELARRAPRRSYALRLAETPISTTDAFIALVKLNDLYAFITDNSGRLVKGIFEANVRDYQGSAGVNHDIQMTLEANDKEDFWWLNNGVTMIGTAATLSSKMLNIEDPQIVNGLLSVSRFRGQG